MTKHTKSKREVFEAALDGSAFVHLDARRVGVVVPDNLKSRPQLVLQFSRNFPVPMRDLTIDDEGVKVTLSFDRKPHRVIVPWSAVFAIVDDSAVVWVWNDDVPLGLEAGRSTPRPNRSLN